MNEAVHAEASRGGELKSARMAVKGARSPDDARTEAVLGELAKRDTSSIFGPGARDGIVAETSVGDATGLGGLGTRGVGGGGGGSGGVAGRGGALGTGIGALGLRGRGAASARRPVGEVEMGEGKIVVRDKRATRRSAVDSSAPSKAKLAALVAPKAKTTKKHTRQSHLPLRAASTDDNVAFTDFVKFLSSWSDRAGTVGYEHVEVRGRRYVRVQDAEGHPVPAARVLIRSGAHKIWSGQTYGDGRTTIYPRSALREGSQDDLQLEVRHEGTRAVMPLGEEETVLTLDTVASKPTQIPIDVCFVIDTTGSMEDEINRIKSTLLSVTQRVQRRHSAVDLRYGAVLYRDRGDAYVTKHHPFTRDIRAFDRLLEQIRANGGGDTPESLNAGLAKAVNTLAWRPNAAKVAFLIADAPPHMDYDGDTTYGSSMRAALAQGIRIHAVAASGLSELGTLVFRQIAQYTRGKFIFIQYGGREASKAKHGVTSQVETNDLDAIIFDQIDAEVAGWGR